jgi:hypothetical protein
MLKYKKESLEKLLLLIYEICNVEDNLWFKQSLENTFSNSANSNTSDVVVKLNSIEKYLSIDGIEIINYSEIENEVVKNQLIRDCIEMSKFRLGKINNVINFDEYCRYAHMQAEELLNYYYQSKFKNIKEINDFIRTYGDYNPTSESKNIYTIGYSFKLNAFVKATGLDYKLKYYIDFVSKVRNEISHRNSFQIQDENKILDTIHLKGMNLNEFFDLKTYSKLEQNLYYKGKFINEKRKQDFKSIMIYLDYLKQAVILLLKN